MRTAISAVVLALLGAACSAGSDEPIPTSTTTTRAVTTTTEAVSRAEDLARISALEREIAWKDDIQSLITQIERTHPNPYWRIREAEFDRMVASVWREIPDLTDDEITVELVRIMATLDGHSGLFTWGLGWDLAHMHFFGFAEGIYAVRADDPALVGARLVAIGDTPIEEAWAISAELSPHDNPATIDLVAPANLLVARVLAAEGIISSPADLTYSLELRDGSVVSHRPALSSLQVRADEFGGGVASLPESDLARYLERKSDAFWWTVLNDGSVYAQYNSVRTGVFDLAEIDAALDAGNGRLIIDLRHNGGGDNNTYRPLLRFLEERFGDSCGLFTIIGRTTFSAATNFATEVDLGTLAVFVGEPTGGSPNLYGDILPVRLFNSDLVARVSAVYWEFGGPDDDRVWIEPEIPVPPTAADYFSGRDAALEAALAAPACGQD